MKCLIFITSLLLFCACEDECEDSRKEYNKAKTEHQNKKTEAAQLIEQLELLDIDDPQQIQEYELINDELGIILLEITMLEITMEDIQKNNFPCSF
jgi:hypothetical protein